MVILWICGIILNKVKVIEKIGEMKFVLSNYFIFIPAFALVEIGRALDIKNIIKLLLVVGNYLIVSLVYLILGFIYCKLSKIDVRTLYSYLLAIGFGNIVSYPSVLVSSLCQSGGALSIYKNCDLGLGYCAYGALILNIIIWIIGPFFLGSENQLINHIRRKFLFRKEFYEDPEEFFKDVNFDKITA